MNEFSIQNPSDMSIHSKIPDNSIEQVCFWEKHAAILPHSVIIAQ